MYHCINRECINANGRPVGCGASAPRQEIGGDCLLLLSGCVCFLFLSFYHPLQPRSTVSSRAVRVRGRGVSIARTMIIGMLVEQSTVNSSKPDGQERGQKQCVGGAVLKQLKQMDKKDAPGGG